MNNKGFTLIELGVLIIFLSSIVLTIVLCSILVCGSMKAIKTIDQQGIKPTIDKIWYGDSTNRKDGR